MGMGFEGKTMVESRLVSHRSKGPPRNNVEKILHKMSSVRLPRADIFRLHFVICEVPFLLNFIVEPEL